MEFITSHPTIGNESSTGGSSNASTGAQNIAPANAADVSSGLDFKSAAGRNPTVQPNLGQGMTLMQKLKNLKVIMLEEI